MKTHVHDKEIKRNSWMYVKRDEQKIWRPSQLPVIGLNLEKLGFLMWEASIN